jgi:lipoprotein-releasing system permease protein
MVFSVRGVLHTGTELDRTLAISGLAALTGLVGTSTVQGLRLHVTDLFAVAQTSRALLPLLPPGFYLTDWTMTHGNLYAAIQLSRRLISLLLLSIIAVAAFNLVSSLILVVIDKREDIAILRALGARPATIGQLFLLQGALVGIFGSLLGCLGGALFSWLVPRAVSALDWQLLSTEVYPVSFIPVDLRPLDFLLVGGAAVVLCLLAAVYPALRAARLAPARVLQGAD